MTTPEKTPADQEAVTVKEAPASPFAALASLKPRSADAPELVTKEVLKDINKVAEDNKFHSRSARPASAKAVRNRRFGAGNAKVQFNIKLSKASQDRYYRIAEKMNVSALGDLIDIALDALEFNIKLSKASQDRYYRIAEEMNISDRGNLIDIALDALEAANKKRK